MSDGPLLNPVVPCPLDRKGSVVIWVRRSDTQKGIAGSIVTLRGPVSAKQETDPLGIATFAIEADGDYALAVELPAGAALTLPQTPPLALRTGQEAEPVIVEARPRLFMLRVMLLHDDGAPYAGRQFQIISGATSVAGATGPAGEVEVELPGTEPRARLELFLDDGESESWDLSLGGLAPPEGGKGLEQRLRNLGFDDVGEFQVAAGHPQATGEMDSDTRAALVALASAED